MDISPPQATEKIVAEVCLKRHHSASHESTEAKPPAKRARMTMEVGVNGETPPHLSGFHADLDDDDEEEEGDIPDRDSATPSFNLVEDRGHLTAGGGVARRRRQSSGDGSGLQTIAGPTSFFGSHQPLSPERSKSPSRMVGKTEFKLLPSVVGGVLSPAKRSIDLSSAILSQFSDEKLKDLASAVSKITNKPTPSIRSGHSHAMSGASVIPYTSIPAVSIPSGPKHTPVPDYGANTPPPEDRSPDHLSFPSQDRLPRVASGPPFPQQMEVMGDRSAAIPPPIPPQASLTKKPTHLGTGAASVGEDQYRNQTVTPTQGNKEWNRDKERFANTPPPEFQPSFSNPQHPTLQQTHQQTQASQYHGNNVNERVQAYPQQHQHAANPPTYYNNNSYPQQHQQHQGGWDHQQQERGAPHDPRRHSREGQSNFSRGDGRGHGHFPHGGGRRGAGNNYHQGSYGQQRRNVGNEKKYSSGGNQYPTEWYRK